MGNEDSVQEALHEDSALSHKLNRPKLQTAGKTVRTAEPRGMRKGSSVTKVCPQAEVSPHQGGSHKVEYPIIDPRMQPQDSRALCLCFNLSPLLFYQGRQLHSRAMRMRATYLARLFLHSALTRGRSSTGEA